MLNPTIAFFWLEQTALSLFFILQSLFFRMLRDISDHKGQFSEPCQNRAAVWWRCGESASAEPDVGWATRPPRLLGEPTSLLNRKHSPFQKKKGKIRNTRASDGGTHVKTWFDEVILFSFLLSAPLTPQTPHPPCLKLHVKISVDLPLSCQFPKLTVDL